MARSKVEQAALKEFGRRVRERRRALGWSLEDAAEECDLHWTYVGQIERHTRNLTLLSILKLSRGLQIDAGDLLSKLHL